MLQIFFQWATGNAANARHVLPGLAEHGRDDREARRELVGDRVELLADRGGIGLGPDRADEREHHLGAALLDPCEHVAQEVDPAALPGGADEHRGDGAP